MCSTGTDLLTESVVSVHVHMYVHDYDYDYYENNKIIDLVVWN